MIGLRSDKKEFVKKASDLFKQSQLCICRNIEPGWSVIGGDVQPETITLIGLLRGH